MGRDSPLLANPAHQHSNMTTPLEESPSQNLPDSAKLIIGNSYIFRPAQFELDRHSGSFRAAGSDSQLVTITGETNQPAINEYNRIKPAIQRSLVTSILDISIYWLQAYLRQSHIVNKHISVTRIFFIFFGLVTIHMLVTREAPCHIGYGYR